MKALMGERIVDAWQVAHEEKYEKWVQHLFDENIMMWHPKYPQQLRFSLLYGGSAREGDYLIQMSKADLKVISPKRFAKEFKIIEDEEE
ncbi:hypothetical protein ACFO26_03360 [Lactococcus nasutitermitis]|uniref:Phage protein n=1 Tax=Lactococcus nasutitermitis TaxID=1652957 RepID=A0ABV9JBZ4_9LACT|nr:hypothetical protein [Lactococcus nasutitermitis]